MQVVQNPDIIASAKIIERLKDRIFKAELPNGKLIHIHFSKSDESELKIEIGDLVKVKMNPFDFSRGRGRKTSRNQGTRTVFRLS